MNNSERAAAKVLEGHFGKRTRCLFIDDNYPIFEPLAEGVSDKIELDYAPDGFTALQMIKQNDYDVILSDINMPFIDGLRLLEEFNRRGYSIPFIFVSGKITNDVTQKALELGAFNLIEKPFEFGEVISKVEMAIHLAKNRQENTMSDQDKAFIYNELKSFCYDPQQIMYLVKELNIPTTRIFEEIEKKSRTGKCMFDDIEYIKLLGSG